MYDSKKYFGVFPVLIIAIAVSACGNRTDLPAETESTIEETEVVAVETDNQSEDLFDVPSGFYRNYEEAEYDKFNSYARDNGLEDTKIWIEGLSDGVMTMKSDDMDIYYTTIEQEDGRKWLVGLDTSIMSIAGDYEGIKGHVLCFRGSYRGFSDVYEMPAMCMTKMFDRTTGTIISSAAFSELDEDSKANETVDEITQAKVVDTTVEEKSTQQTSSSEEKIETDVDNKTPTMGEKNALAKAKEYLRLTAFSRKGLIEQLEFEGFTNTESEYGADNCGADWNQQAAKKAKEYLDLTSFSRQSLIEQLEFEGFTHDQAEYGVKQAGF